MYTYIYTYIYTYMNTHISYAPEGVISYIWMNNVPYTNTEIEEVTSNESCPKCTWVMAQSGPCGWGLFYRGPTVGQDLGIYRSVAKPYQGPLYQAGRWLIRSLSFSTYSFRFLGCQPPVVNPRVDNPKGRIPDHVPVILPGSRARITKINRAWIKPVLLWWNSVIGAKVPEWAHAARHDDCQNFQQVFTGVPVHIKHVFTGVPKISYKFFTCVNGVPVTHKT